MSIQELIIATHLVLVGAKSLKLRRLKTDLDEIWQDIMSSGKSASIDGVRLLI